jgi:hypothetical protein
VADSDGVLMFVALVQFIGGAMMIMVMKRAATAGAR